MSDNIKSFGGALLRQAQMKENMTTIEKYSNSRFGHIERKRKAFNEVVVVFDDVKGEIYSKHSTMEGAKDSLAKLNRKKRS